MLGHSVAIVSISGVEHHPTKFALPDCLPVLLLVNLVNHGIQVHMHPQLLLFPIGTRTPRDWAREGLLGNWCLGCLCNTLMDLKMAGLDVFGGASRMNTTIKVVS